LLAAHIIHSLSLTNSSCFDLSDVEQRQSMTSARPCAMQPGVLRSDAARSVRNWNESSAALDG